MDIYIRAEKLKELRKEKGDTQTKVAKGAGLSVRTIYSYEHDRVKRPELETISKLTDYYEVDSSYIVRVDNE